jgi:hypothetical protein
MKYRAKPVEVNAYRIQAVGDLTPCRECELGNVAPHPEDSARLLVIQTPNERGYEETTDVTATHEMLARYTPVPGDYWVVQADGYVYLNPKDVFERKYEPMDEAAK